MMLEQLQFRSNDFSFPAGPVKQGESPVNNGADFLSMIKENMYNSEKSPSSMRDVENRTQRDDPIKSEDHASVRQEETKYEETKLPEKENLVKDSGETNDKRDVKTEAKETVHLKGEQKDDNTDQDWEKIEKELLDNDLIVSLLGKEGIKELVSAMKSLSGKEGKSIPDSPGLESLLAKLEGLSVKNMEELPGFSELSDDKKENFKKVFSDLKNLLQKGSPKQVLALLDSDQNAAAKISTKDLQKFMDNLLSLADVKKGRPGRNHEKKSLSSSDKNSTALAGELPVLNKVTISADLSRDTSMKDGSENKDSLSFSSGRNLQADSLVNDKQSMQSRMPEFKQSLQEIIDKAKITVRDSRNGKFNVKLYPKELGNVNVTLSLENGVVHGRFLVDNDEAKNLLMQNLDHLRQMLKESGIEVGDFSVNVSDQREQFAGDDSKDGGNSLTEQNSDKVLIAGEYEINSAAVHNGRINMVV